MHLYPVVNRFIVAGVCAVALMAHAADAFAQMPPNRNTMAVALTRSFTCHDLLHF